MTLAALPTPKHEAWRYSDHRALAELWPVTPAAPLTIAAGEAVAQALIVDQATIVHDHKIVVAADGRFTLHLLNLAGRYGRIALDVTLYRGAHFELGAVQVGGGDATLELVTAVHHVEPEATSNQLVRSVLAGHATGSYLGKVAVARNAQKVDASQGVRAMLLDRTATANAKPELEIYADDVKCAHGAAIGELDRNALFYLASRGLPPAAARTLLLQAFVSEVFEGAEDRHELEARALQALEALA